MRKFLLESGYIPFAFDVLESWKRCSRANKILEVFDGKSTKILCKKIRDIFKGRDSPDGGS
jgi:hypothetical protein